MSDELAKARATLLRALEQLDKAEIDLGDEPDRVDLVVAYDMGFNDEDGWHHVGGWAASPGPKWAHSALLDYAAEAHYLAIDDEPDDDDER